MNPEQPQANTPQPAQPTQATPPQQPAASQPAPAAVSKVPFYRKYWVFGAIYIILSPIIGLIILFTGEIYRKQPNGGAYEPISRREKITLTIVAFVLWGLYVMSKLAKQSGTA